MIVGIMLEAITPSHMQANIRRTELLKQRIVGFKNVCLNLCCPIIDTINSDIRSDNF